MLCHVRGHLSEVDSSQFGELLHAATSSVDRDHPALSFGVWTFDRKANALYS